MNKIRAALSLAAAAGMLAAVPGTAQAASVPTVGSLTAVFHGMPATVRRGTTVNVVLWYKEKSP